jgi:hypothetical protein
VAAGIYIRTPKTAIPTDLPEHHAAAAVSLYLAENRLRALVVDSLMRLDQFWWTARVPEELVVKAESRHRDEEAATASAEQLHPIMYLSLGEVLEILQYGENWDEVFRLSTGRSRDALGADRDMLIAVRNKVAHNRPVTKSDLDALLLSARRLGLLDESDPDVLPC